MSRTLRFERRYHDCRVRSAALRGCKFLISVEWDTRAAQSICDEGRGVKGDRARVGRGFASRRVPQHVSIGSLRIHSPPIEARLHREPYRPLNVEANAEVYCNILQHSKLVKSVTRSCYEVRKRKSF
ncbi:unnamed protein product [Pieris brassicae]|uniref:Uncharacterized protein n=1 Tax=Pieris brassicae TaxID=7116 RepID=A0A9P0U408_PIEBR|nr:unnamed protein product [Pieris brassicae]